MCPGCRQKRELAWDQDTNGWWEAHDVACQACAALAHAQKERKDPEPGTYWHVSLDDGYKPSGAPLLKQDQPVGD